MQLMNDRGFTRSFILDFFYFGQLRMLKLLPESFEYHGMIIYSEAIKKKFLDYLDWLIVKNAL